MAALWCTCFLKILVIWVVPAQLADALVRSVPNQSNLTMVITDSGTGYTTGRVLQCPLQGSVNCTELLLSSPSPRSPVYDPVEDYIYWTDSSLDAICRVKSTGENYNNSWAKLSPLSRPPTIIIQPQKVVYFKEGEFVQLPCVADAVPNATYSWTKDGSSFIPNSLDGVSQLPGIGTLVILEPEQRHEGLYQCLAQNDHGRSLSIKINLLRAVLDVFPADFESPHRIALGQSLTLRCVPPRSIPEPLVAWFRRQNSGIIAPVILDDRVTMDPEYGLHFTNVKAEDYTDGYAYVCFAFNEILRKNTNGNQQYIQPDGTADSVQPRPPRLMWASPTEIYGLRGETFRLKCIFAGNPTPVVNWTRLDGQPFSNHTKQSTFGQELVFENLDYSDQGEYNCWTTYQMDSSYRRERSVSVRVESPPYWLEEPQDIQLSVGSTGKIKCPADGRPKPDVTWFINGVTLADVTDTRVDQRFKKLSPTEIIFMNVTLEDSMVIQCNASNKHGYIWADMYLNIIDTYGLAIDPGLRRIFVSANGLHSIDMESEVVSVVRNDTSYGDLALDTTKRKLFLSASVNGTIHMMNYDGSELKTVVSSDLDEPTGITYDPEGETLYFCDKSLHKLESLDLNTKNRTLLHDTSRCLSLSLYEGSLYFTAQNSDAIFQIQVSDGNETYFLLNLPVSGRTGITVFNPYGCSPKWYGYKCDKPCGNCNQTVCDSITGVCPFGCESGWVGETCHLACTNGTYGDGCNNTCGQCAGQSPCDHVTGVCDDDCEEGWIGDRCTDKKSCSPKWYGYKCDKPCGNCNQTVCDSITGVCPFGCESGWVGETCHLACTNGTYGDGCNNTCGQCAGQSPCDHVTGVCDDDCEEGWIGDRCTDKKSCSPKWYGYKCDKPCGNCNQTVCDSITGVCPFGCESGWVGETCHLACTNGTYGDGCNNTCGQCAGQSPCDHVTGVCDDDCEEGWIGDRCTDKKKAPVTSKAHFADSLFVLPTLTVLWTVHLMMITLSRVKTG